MHGYQLVLVKYVMLPTSFKVGETSVRLVRVLMDRRKVGQPLPH